MCVQSAAECLLFLFRKKVFLYLISSGHEEWKFILGWEAYRKILIFLVKLASVLKKLTITFLKFKWVED